MKQFSKISFGTLALSFLALVSVSSQAALTEGKVYKDMPWHLADIWWTLPQDAIANDFRNIEVDVTITGELDDSLRLYIAPFGLGKLSETKFYGGLQTHMLAQTKTNEGRQDIGHGGIFSMWGERDLDAIRPAEGGFMESSGHEGDFISIRRKVNWSQGKYTCRMQLMDEVAVGEKPFSWVGYFIHDHQKDEQIYCGSLRFPGHDLKLDKSVAGFVEIFGRRPEDDVIPRKVAITFSAPRVNGQEAGKTGCVAIHPKGVPDVLHVAPISVPDGAKEAERAVVFTFAESEFEREKRQYRLYPGRLAG